MINPTKLYEYNDKGDCFAITSYCNSIEKVATLNKTITTIKEFGLPIFLHAHFPVPDYVVDRVDYYFYSSNNPILNRYNTFWGFTDGGKIETNDWGIEKGFRLEITEYDHYYTTLKGWTESIKIMSEFDKIHMINYDSHIYPELFNVSKEQDLSIFMQHHAFWRNMEHIFLLYFCIKKDMYDYFISEITMEKYLNYWEISKSTFLPSIEEMLGSFLPNHKNTYIIPHEDLDFEKLMSTDISADGRFDWTKSLNVGRCKMFIGKLKETAHLLIFGAEKGVNINVQSGSGEIEKLVVGYELLDLQIPFDGTQLPEIFVDGKWVDREFIDRFYRLESKITLI